MSNDYDSTNPMFANDDYGTIVSIPLANTPERREILERCGKDWAFVLWEPTPEEREAQAEVFRELGRKARDRVDAIVWEVLTRDV